jgi:hypothetical protein
MGHWNRGKPERSGAQEKECRRDMKELGGKE